MRRSLLSLTAAGLAVLVLAGSVAAAGPYAGGAQSAQGARRGGGGGAGAGAGAGRGPVATVPAAPLTATQAASLLRMAEDEKLAFDLYTAFAAQYGDATFATIARSEATHLARVRTLLARYGIADVTANLAPGVYADTEIQGVYDALLEAGSASLEAAYEAGRTVEVTDIADLDASLAAGGLPTDVSRVWANLRAGSVHHLAAFEALLAG